jgi:hypothetical protein
LSQAEREALALKLVRLGLLAIDDRGRIWRTGRLWNSRVAPGARKRAERTSKNGYLRVQFRVGKRVVSVMAHRLVWLVFRGPLEAGIEVNHKDYDRRNNDPDNLEPLNHIANMAVRGGYRTEKDWIAIAAAGLEAAA